MNQRRQDKTRPLTNIRVKKEFLFRIKKRIKRLKLKLSEEQNHKCCLCGWKLNEAPEKSLSLGDWIATFEHIIPLRNGGLDEEHNLAISHSICNRYRDIIKGSI